MTGGLSKRETTKEAAEKMNIMNLEDRRLLHLYQHARWIVTTGRYEDTRQLRTRSHTSSRYNLWLEAPRKSQFQNSFIYRACNIWNKLPTEVQQDRDENSFKTKIKNILKVKRKDLEES